MHELGVEGKGTWRGVIAFGDEIGQYDHSRFCLRNVIEEGKKSVDGAVVGDVEGAILGVNLETVPVVVKKRRCHLGQRCRGYYFAAMQGFGPANQVAC